MSSKNLVQLLKKIATQRQKLIAAFLKKSPLIVGSITQTKGRCGKPNCICAEKPAHEVTLLMSTEDKKRTSQLIRKNDIAEVREQWQHYKALKKSLSGLKELNKKEIEILKQLINSRKRTYT